MFAYLVLILIPCIKGYKSYKTKDLNGFGKNGGGTTAPRGSLCYCNDTSATFHT